MIDTAYVQCMARYNRWQNGSLYGAAATLGDIERRRERGAFFGSIHKTLNHILWGDTMWMHRFAGTPKPNVGIKDSGSLNEHWDDLVAARQAADTQIENWAETLDADWLKGDLTWHSAALGADISRPVWLLVTHFFNHQTHHRGQVHAMLTAAGAKPDDTDLMLLPAIPSSRIPSSRTTQ